MARSAWGVWQGKKDVHAAPIGDLVVHQKSRYCWCKPEITDEEGDPAWIGTKDGVVVTHRAVDGRE